VDWDEALNQLKQNLIKINANKFFAG